MTAGDSKPALTITPQPALAPSPQPRPAPTARALPPGLVAQVGQNWTPIVGQNWMPIDRRGARALLRAQCHAQEELHGRIFLAYYAAESFALARRLAHPTGRRNGSTRANPSTSTSTPCLTSASTPRRIPLSI